MTRQLNAASIDESDLDELHDDSITRSMSPALLLLPKVVKTKIRFRRLTIPARLLS